MKKQTLTIILCVFLVQLGYAQYELSSVYATGSGIATTKVTDSRAIGINPANVAINKSTKSWHVTFFEIGASLYTDALTRTELNNDFWTGDTDFTLAQKQEAANNFTNSTLVTDLDLTWFAIAYQGKKVGVAFNIKEKLHAKFNTNRNLAEIIFLGKDAPYFDQQIEVDGIPTGVASNPRLYSAILEDDARWGINWYREFNLAIGANFVNTELIKLYGGVGLKYLIGYGTFDVGVVDDELKMYSALNPVFDIDWGDAQTPSRVEGDGIKKVGAGVGLDLGVTAEFINAITVSLAVTDLGNMTWDGNVYKAIDQPLEKLEADGFDNYNIFEEAQEFDDYFGVFEWVGVEEVEAGLPSLLRFGAQYDNGGVLGGGFDLLASLSENPGSLNKTMFNVGGWVRPVDALEFSLGFVTGGNYEFNIPMGLNINVRDSWEFGIAVRDIKTYFSENTPNVSVAFGFLRFGI